MKVYGALERAQVENVVSDPMPGLVGRIIYNTVSSKFKIDTGAAWLALMSGSILESYTTVGRPAFGNAGRTIWDTTLGALVVDTGAAWILAGAGDTTLNVISWFIPGLPVSGDGHAWLKVPFKHTLISAYAVCKTQGSTLATFDIYRCSQANIDGTISWASIFSTPLTMDSSTQSSSTATTPVVIGSPTGAANDHYKLDATGIAANMADVTVVLVFRMNNA
jgi:hypothetical protein